MSHTKRFFVWFPSKELIPSILGVLSKELSLYYIPIFLLFRFFFSVKEYGGQFKVYKSIRVLNRWSWITLGQLYSFSSSGSRDTDRWHINEALCATCQCLRCPISKKDATQKWFNSLDTNSKFTLVIELPFSGTLKNKLLAKVKMTMKTRTKGSRKNKQIFCTSA